MIVEHQDQFFNESIEKIKNISGVDVIYFLKDRQILKEHCNASGENYFEQIQNMLKSNSVLFSDEFHTCSLLNESGLIIILRLDSLENLYMIIVAGENEPVDLLNLLKICKEVRGDFENHMLTNT